LMLNHLSEFIKVAELAVTAVLGSVEDERTFSTLRFMKSKIRNRLGIHLQTCAKCFHWVSIPKKLYFTTKQSRTGKRKGNGGVLISEALFPL
jgi:hypothetical protein